MKTIDHVREGTVARYTEANGFKLAICVDFGRGYQPRVRLYRATAGKWTNPELVDRAHLAPLGKIEIDGPSRQHVVLTKALEALWTTPKLGLGPAHVALLVVTAAQVQQAVRRERCPARDNAHHAAITCDGSCCTTCGGPIDDNEECRC